MSQVGIAGKPTSRQVAATATILPAATNDRTEHRYDKIISKFISEDGRVTAIRNPHSRTIIIIDLP
jgi:hypothetical protein